jgi:hypothetical protein
MAKANTSKATPKSAPEPKFTRAELLEALAEMNPDEKLKLIGQVTTKEERQEVTRSQSARAKAEDKAKKEAEATRTRLAEQSHIKSLEDDELYVYGVQHQAKAERITRLSWSGSEWVETVLWDFGAERTSRSGQSISKRVIDPERVVFQSGTRLEYKGTEYVHASKVCEAMGVTWKPDSAARVLCNKALETKTYLGVTVRVTTPAGTTSTDLLKYASTERVKIALETRPE